MANAGVRLIPEPCGKVGRGDLNIDESYKTCFVLSNSIYYVTDDLEKLVKQGDELLVAGHVADFKTTSYDVRQVC